MEEFERAAQLATLAAAAVLVVDLDGTVRAATREAGELTGVEPSGRWSLVVPDELDPGERGEVTIRDPGGRTLAVQASAATITAAADGRPIGHVVTLHPTGSASLPPAFRGRLSQVLDRFPGPVVADRDGEVIYANPAARRLFGVEDIAVLRDWIGGFRHVPGVDLDLVRTRLAAVRRGELLPSAAEYELHRPDGEVRIVEWLTSAATIDGQTMLLYSIVDLTAARRAAEATARSEVRYRRLAESLPVAVFETDPLGCVTYANRRWCEYTGRPAEALLGEPWWSPVDGDELAAVLAAIDGGRREHSAVSATFRLRRPDATALPVQAEGVPSFDTDGRLVGWIGTATDLTAEIALRHAAEASEARFRLLADRSADIVARIELDPFRIGFVSRAVIELTGVTPEELYEHPELAAVIVHPDDHEAVLRPLERGVAGLGRLDPIEFRVVHRNGEVRTVEAIARIVIETGEIPLLEATVRDVTSRVREREVLGRLASRDALTGLANRRALMTALELRLADPAADVAVLFFDLDRFKRINDRLGHDVGDEVLVAFADRLAAAVRADDVVARLAGDEFVVLATVAHAEAIAARVLASLREPILEHDGGELRIGVSVGIATAVSGGDSEELLRRADQAMYEAKRRGAGQVVNIGPTGVDGGGRQEAS